MSSPLISIITPSFMQGAYISSCIGSIKAQTYTNFEHLVFDACSTDDTSRVLQQHQGTYPLQYFRERDRGPADAINKGLDRARGEIVCWLNADDAFASPTVLERAVDVLLQSGASAVTGDGAYISPDGRCLGPIRGSQRAVELPRMRISDNILQPATFWRANGLRLDTTLKYVFDWKLWMDMLESGGRILHVPEEWALYRLHGLSLTQQDPARRRKEIYDMAGRNGCGFTQRAWCGSVYAGFLTAETLHSPLLKRLVQKANSAMSLATGGDIVSC